MDLFIETKTIGTYGKMLAAEEKSAGTIEKYLRDVKAFALWLDKRPMSKEETANWRHHLLDRGYTPTTINSMLSSLNRFFVSSATTNTGPDFCGFSGVFSGILPVI